jgi:tRNA-Thr(GGU) m(6)t(6)A37 methyltransferase TsaA
MSFIIEPIGKVNKINEEYLIELNSEFNDGLIKIEDFSHLQIIWWAHLTDKTNDRKKLIAENLFKNTPKKLGIFGTRAPFRPNPIMISTVKVEDIDKQNGIIKISFIDALPNTPILDIKPYFPMERIKNCCVPKYFNHWPKWAEDAAAFNWQNEINLD